MRNVRRLFLRCLRLGHRRKFTYLNLLTDYLRYCRLCLVSLTYNSFTNSDVVIESLFEPIYWLVDHVTRWFGIVSIYILNIFLPLVNILVFFFFLNLYIFLGVCGSGDHTDKLHSIDRVYLCPTSHPPNIFRCLDLLAYRLWPLESHPNCLSLLQSNHYTPRIPTTGTTFGTSYRILLQDNITRFNA